MENNLNVIAKEFLILKQKLHDLGAKEEDIEFTAISQVCTELTEDIKNNENEIQNALVNLFLLGRTNFK